MPTYFGYTTIGASPVNLPAFWIRNKSYVTGFTCPGTGNQAVKELSVYCKSGGGTAGHIRIAVYDASHNLICQGTAEVTINSTTADWLGHLTQADITPNPCNLTGGVQYDLSFSGDSTDLISYYNSGAADAYTIDFVDYTNGFPSTLADASDVGFTFSIRCGVDPSAQHYTLTAEGGSYSETGQAAGLRAARKIAATAASYPLTGQTVGLKAARKIAAGAGSFTLSGQLAALRAARRIAAAPDSYALTGQSVDLKRTRRIAAGAGSYLLTGQDTILRAIRKMAALGGSYVLTGQAANLVIGQHYILTAEQGYYGEPYSKIFVTLDGRIYKKMGNTYLRLG